MAVSIAITSLCFFKTTIINKDAVSYIYCAQHIADGKWSEATEYRQMPFFPMLIIAVHWIVGDWELSGQLLSILATILLTIPFYWLVHDLFGKASAFIATLFLAVSPSLKFNSVIVMRDTVFLLFLAFFLLFFFRAVSLKQKKYYLAALLFSCLAFLTRLEGILLVMLYVGMLTWFGLRSSNPSIRRFTVALIGVIVLFGSTVFYTKYPTISRMNQMHEILDVFKNPKHYYETQMKVNQVYLQMKEMEKTMPGGDYSGGALQTARYYLPLIYLISLIHILAETCFPVMFFLSCLGLYACFSWKNKEHRYLTFWTLFFLAIPYFFLFKENFLSHRYLLSASLLFSCWCGVGFEYLFAKIQEKVKIQARWGYLLLAILLVIPVCKVAMHHMEKGKSIRDAAAWLRQNPQDGSILSNDPRLFLYAGIYYYKADKKYRILEPQDLQNLLTQKPKGTLLFWYGDPLNLKEVRIFTEKKKTLFVYSLSE